MLFRAVFWIAVVSVLMPREPDLGFGRPGSANSPGGEALHWVEGAAASSTECRDGKGLCAALPGLLDALKGSAVRSLAQVKAEIEEQQRLRAVRGGRSLD